MVVLVVGALVAAGGGVAVGDPLHDPIKVEVPAPIEGTFDPMDPPLVAAVDPDMALLDVPGQHPWMLFEADELPAIRERVLGADPTSVVGRAWAGMQARVDACCDGRSSYQDGLEDLESRSYGRDDLAELGFAWQITGDDVYLEKARGLLQYVVATAPDHGAPREPGVDEFYIQRAHRLNGFALAYDLLHPGFTAEERAQLLGVVTALGQQQFGHAATAWWGTTSSGSNIGAVNAASLATAGLALWHEVPEARAWVVRGEQLTRAYFHEGFDSEGAGIEGVLYGNYGMRVPTFLNHALRQTGHPGIDRVGGVDRQQEWVAYEVLPGGGAVNPINDARYYEFNPYFTLWSGTHGDTPALSRWIHDEVRLKGPRAAVDASMPTILWYEEADPDFDPSSMLPLAKAFPGRGLVHVRSGWDEGDLMASFESRQNDWGESVHQNQDVNSFVLYAEGARLVVDSRYANWLAKTAGGDAEAGRTSETEAHNYLVADGRSQDFLGKGDLRAFASTAGEVGETGGLDIAVGDARKAYMTDQPQRAERVFLHVREGRGGTGDYVVVADRFEQGGGDHDHTWFLHTDWSNTMTRLGSDPGRVRVDAPNGAGMSVTMHAAQPFTSSVGSFTPDDAQDWRHLGAGRRAQPRLEVSSTGAAFESIAVLAPTAPGERAPTVRAVPADGGIAVVVEHGAFTDLVLLKTGDAATVSAAGHSTDATFAMVRRNRGGKVLASTMVDGSSFDADGAPLLVLPAGVGAVVSSD
ncbi:MAG TPA: heparinase II/III family protein [Acidimicrobiales bacterium]|nr:heparinase II/III family protein [Acidimicrobiales bacterium]